MPVLLANGGRAVVVHPTLRACPPDDPRSPGRGFRDR